MLRRLKQIFCDHFFYSYVQHKPYYISSGDEYHDRRSTHYYHICQRCNKKIESVSKWNGDEIKAGMLNRPLPQAIEPIEQPSAAAAESSLEGGNYEHTKAD